MCAQSGPTLCDPMDCSPRGSSVHGVLQARTLEWAAISSSRASSWPRDPTLGFLLWQAGSLTLAPPRRVKVKSLSPVPTLHDPMDCSPPGSSVHGLFQTKILERVAISFSRGSSRPRDSTLISCTAGRLYHLRHQGSATWDRSRQKII